MDKLAPWERMQAKTFTGWANSFLAREQLAITNIETDLGDGIKRTYPRIWYFFVFPKVSFRVHLMRVIRSENVCCCCHTASARFFYFSANTPCASIQKEIYV